MAPSYVQKDGLDRRDKRSAKMGIPADDWMSMKGCHLMPSYRAEPVNPLKIIKPTIGLESVVVIWLLYYYVHRLDKATEDVLIPLCFLPSQVKRLN